MHAAGRDGRRCSGRNGAGVYGILAAYTPVLRLRRVDGAYFGTYLESFERVRGSARPLGDEQAGDGAT